MAATEVTMRVWRGDAKGGAFVEYRVPSQEGMVVLDVIHTLQATQAGDLACRWNCKAGKCGSCSAEIDGKPRLMCMTRMDTFTPGETITVAPMKTFPIYRDLATDVSFNYEKAKTIPAFKPKPKEPDGTRYSTKAPPLASPRHTRIVTSVAAAITFSPGGAASARRASRAGAPGPR